MMGQIGSKHLVAKDTLGKASVLQVLCAVTKITKDGGNYVVR